MIDLLVHKVVVFNDHIEITFKYVKGSPTDERPKKLNKHLTKNMSLDTSRGSLFISYDYPSICLLTHGISALRYFGYGLLVYACNL